MHQYVEPLQPNVPEKNIDYNERINQRDILSSCILKIVSVRLLQFTNHIIDDRKILTLLYTSSSAACTIYSGLPPFLLLWWNDNFTTLYFPAQHVRSGWRSIYYCI